VKVLSLNCCSLRSSLKKASLLALINEHKPNIICGCESHLDESYLSAEIFPKDYNVFRKDRNAEGRKIIRSVAWIWSVLGVRCTGGL